MPVVSFVLASICSSRSCLVFMMRLVRICFAYVIVSFVSSIFTSRDVSAASISSMSFCLRLMILPLIIALEDSIFSVKFDF